MKWTTYLFLAALISGCATLPNNAPQYFRAVDPAPGYSNVYIYRIGAYPTRRTPTVTVDGSKIFDPPERSYTVIPLLAGAHEVKVDWALDTGAEDAILLMEVISGRSLYIKISGRVSGHRFNTFVDSLTQGAAETELAECCRHIEPEK